MKNAIPVVVLRPGEEARVIALNASEPEQIRKLTAFGVLPGAKIKVLQTFPAYVLKVDHTQLALDHSMAQKIMVER